MQSTSSVTPPNGKNGGSTRPPRRRRLELHWQILIGLVAGAVVGGLIGTAGGGEYVSARLLANYQDQAGARISGTESLSVIDQLLAIVPTNPFAALAGGNMLQIVFFALLVGLALTLVPAEEGELVTAGDAPSSLDSAVLIATAEADAADDPPSEREVQPA